MEETYVNEQGSRKKNIRVMVTKTSIDTCQPGVWEMDARGSRSASTTH